MEVNDSQILCYRQGYLIYNKDVSSYQAQLLGELNTYILVSVVVGVILGIIFAKIFVVDNSVDNRFDTETIIK